MIVSTTRLVAIIGSPITQVKSPENFNRHFEAETLDWAMIPIDIQPERIKAFVETVHGWCNLDGFVVTIPHKGAVAELVDDLSERAKFLGAANVVRRHQDGRLSGDMTDGEGFLGAAMAHGFLPNEKSVLLVGAGAAGSAIGHALADSGVSRIVICDLDHNRAVMLAARLADAFPTVSIVAGEPPQQSFDLVVNASFCGMHPDDPLPVPETIIDLMPATGLVADVTTGIEHTPLLSLAMQRGLTVQTGKEMAKAQLHALGRAMGVIGGGSTDD